MTDLRFDLTCQQNTRSRHPWSEHSCDFPMHCVYTGQSWSHCQYTRCYPTRSVRCIFCTSCRCTDRCSWQNAFNQSINQSINLSDLVQFYFSKDWRVETPPRTSTSHLASDPKCRPPSVQPRTQLCMSICPGQRTMEATRGNGYAPAWGSLVMVMMTKGIYISLAQIKKDVAFVWLGQKPIKKRG